MSFLTPLSTIQLDLNEEKEEKEENEESCEAHSMSSLKIKKLPNWLLEFDTFSVNDNKFKHKTNSRPLTESSVSQRPKWFEELAQQRRSSQEFATIEPQTPLFHTNGHNSVELIQFEANIKRKNKRMDAMDANKEAIDDLKITKSYASIPKEVDINLDQINNSKLLGNSFKSCSNLLFDFDDNFVEFIIPELPFGQQLVFEIVTNWGDEDFVGLNGIEILDLNGTDLRIEKIWSEPQTKGNLNALIDGIYRTHDDSHIWLTHLEAKSLLPIKVFIQFQSKISIALIRIWNYNKSRIYSYRGIKFLTIKFDNKLIFKGEIAKASGDLIGSIEAFGDTILFTTDENILESVALRDNSFQELVNELIPLTQK